MAMLLNSENDKHPELVQQGMMYGNSPMDMFSYELRSVNELFPSFEVSCAYMLIVIILYILIIGPFFILY